VPAELLRFVAGRLARAIVLMFAVSSASMLLVHLAPGDAFSSFELDPRVAAVERARLGLNRPFPEQYATWLSRAVRLDFGESSRFRRPVATLLRERAGNTIFLGSAALVIALGVGIPIGVLTGSHPRRWWSALLRGVALVLASTPPLVTALVLLLVAAHTGWLPTGGIGSLSTSFTLAGALPYVVLPALALALPVAASLERLQSTAMREALSDPSIAAARARGVSPIRATWVHAWRLSLRSVLGVLGIIIGTVLGGSFVVEIVTTWPGLGDLMYEALRGRDIYLAAGCAAAGAAFLSISLVASDTALALVDPRTLDRG
jgi:ABC-type dipeptide/oligopeptide/nickel transport system permease component